MPDRLPGKMIITNTVTSQDISEMKEKGVKVLVTTTPEMNNRSFGTNVLQAIFVAVLEKKPEDIKPEEYLELMKELNIKPRVIKL